MIFDFNTFINEGKIKQVAGVAIKWQDSVLLVHPTNASWKNSAYGIPKGGIEQGEDTIDAAIRELREETGIIVRKSDLDPSPSTAHYHDSSGNIKSHLTYYTMTIQDPSDVGLSSSRVPKDQLQLEEIDWAGFVKIDDAYPKMHRSQIIILDRLK